MLTMRELVIADDGHTGPIVTDDNQTTRYRTAAAHLPLLAWLPGGEGCHEYRWRIAGT
jgi:hypothetical protein